MQREGLIISLAAVLQWDEQKVEEVLTAFTTVITEQLVANHIINLFGFGLFKVKKMEEYVSVNKSTKQRFLVPPRLIPTFIFDDAFKTKEQTHALLDEGSLYFEDIVSLMVEKQNIDTYDAYAMFLNSLITWFKHEITAGWLVTIGSLGDFQIEPQPLENRLKFYFYPAKELQDSVNKPFLVFEITPIAEGVHFEEIDIIEEDSILSKEATIAYCSFPSSSVCENHKEMLETILTSNKQKQTNRGELLIAALVLLFFIALSLGIKIIYNNSILNPKKDIIITESLPIIDNNEKLLTPDLDALSINTIIDSNAVIEDSIIIELPVETPMEDYIGYEVIKKGSRLTSLALQYYGHKIFWVYLYQANMDSIKDPNNISIGTKIRIPAPSLYNIDAKDKSSKMRATALQKEILEKKGY